jgi:hypothetical protein
VPGGEIIDICVDKLAQATPDVVMGVSHYMHGEVCRVKPEATAFSASSGSRRPSSCRLYLERSRGH